MCGSHHQTHLCYFYLQHSGWLQMTPSVTFMPFDPLLSVNFAFTVQSVKLMGTKEPLCSLRENITDFSRRASLPALSPRKDTGDPSLLPCKTVLKLSCLQASPADGSSFKWTLGSGLNASVSNLGLIGLIMSIKLIFLRLESQSQGMIFFFSWRFLLIGFYL